MNSSIFKSKCVTSTLCAILMQILLGCQDAKKPVNNAALPNVQEKIEIKLQGNTMEGNEVEASNGMMTLRVKGLYQQLFSADWFMGVKVKPLRDLTISKVTCYSFTGKNIRLRDSEITFHPPAGEFRREVEREVDVRFYHPAASMLLTYYNESNEVIGKFEITQIVDHMIEHHILPAENREVYLNAKE